MVVGQKDNNELGQFAFELKLPEFADELGRTDHVGDLQIPADRVGVAVRPERSDAGLAPNAGGASAGLKFMPEVTPGDPPGSGRKCGSP